MGRTLWNRLPPEVLELVLACLPVHVLCRFRLVCKKWNHLITQPAFAHLRTQAPPRSPYVLFTPKVMNYNLWDNAKREKFDWKILDTVEGRYFTLSDSFITDYHLQVQRSIGYRRGFEFRGWSRCTLAADGGLIYAMYKGASSGQKRHIIANPVTKEIHQIPEINIHDQDIVVMAVDNATQSFRIVTMQSSGSCAVSLYESTSSQWRSLSKVPGKYRPYSCIFLKGMLYGLFVDLSILPRFPKLYSCDLLTGVWSFIDVELPEASHPQDMSQLVMSWGRLFLVEYTGIPRRFEINVKFTDCDRVLTVNQLRKKHVINVKISEVLLAEKEVWEVAEMPKYAKYSRSMLNRAQDVRGDSLVALGCGSLIVVSSLVGRRVGWDLLKKCWHELPVNLDSMKPRDVYKGFYAGLVNF